MSSLLMPAILLFLMVAAELVLFALPAVLWVAIGRQRWGDAFSWRRPTWQEMVGAVFLAVGMVYCVPVALIIQCHFIPGLTSGLRASTLMFLPMMERYPWGMIILLPLSAAVAEEMFFRGPLQRALLRRLPVWPALTMGALIFALLHFDLLGLFARVVLGLIFGWMVLRGGSIFPAMLMHFIYDAALFASSVWQLHVYGADYLLATSSDPFAGVTRASLLVSIGLGAVLLLIGYRLCSFAYKRRAALLSVIPISEPAVEVT